MPIRPEYRHFYASPHWDATRNRILGRANFKCEICGARNGSRYWRYVGPPFVGTVYYPEYRFYMPVVQLGIAHLNHTPGDDRDENLLALCRRCHLAQDAAQHKQTRELRKDAGRPLLVVVTDDGGD